MRKLPGLFLSFAALAVLAGLNPASASPPSGNFSFTEHGRAQQVADGTVTVPVATDIVSALYTLAPEGNTGWRKLPGDTVIAVTKGAVAVEQGEGCGGARRDLAAGNALVIPAGRFRLRNDGGQPAEFAGTFLNLPVGRQDPLVDGAADPGPGCGGVSATEAPQGVSATGFARGTTPAYSLEHDHESHGDHHAAASDQGSGYKTEPTVYSIKDGLDVFVTTFKLEPGFSSGWNQHTDEVAILLKGTIGYWEGHDGKCVKVEEYRPGAAWAHKPHPHLVTNEGQDTIELRLVGFNLKHGEPMPVFGSNLDHFDFSKMPPEDCPRFR